MRRIEGECRGEGVPESECCSGEGSVSEGFKSGWWYC